MKLSSGRTLVVGLATALLLGCSSNNGASSASATCIEPKYDASAQTSPSMTAAQWNDRRFSCIEHFANFYAKGSDAADVIGEVVASYSCEAPIRMMAQATAKERDVTNDLASIQAASRLSAIEDVLQYRARGCSLATDKRGR